MPLCILLFHCSPEPSCSIDIHFEARFNDDNKVIYRSNPSINVSYSSQYGKGIITLSSRVYCFTDAVDLYFNDGDDYEASVANPSIIVYKYKGWNYLKINLHSKLSVLGEMKVDLEYDSCCNGVMQRLN